MTREQPSSPLAVVFSYIILGAGAVTLVFSLFVAIRAYSPFWFSDQWSLGSELTANAGHYPLPLLWAQHNEHRIPILKLLSLADLYFFGGRNLFLYTCNWIVQIAMFTLSVYAVRKLGFFSAWQFRTLVGVLAFCEFNPNQLENFTVAFQSAFFMAFFFALLAICCLMFYVQRTEQTSEQRHTRLLWLCVAAAFLSECSLASGLIVWIILPFCLVMTRRQEKLLRPFLVFGIFSIVLYLVGYQSQPQHTQPGQALQKPFQILAYIQTYLGASWDNISRDLGLFLSPLAIVFVAVAWIWALVRREAQNYVSVASVSMAMLCLLSALMTALGRLNFGVNQATSSRYQTPAMLFWCFGAIAVICVPGASKKYRTAGFVALQVTCLVLFAFQTKAYGSILATYEAAAFNRDVSGLALEAGADPQRIYLLFPNLEPIKWYGFMRTHDIIPPPFPEYSHVGAQLQSVYQIAPTTMCQGYIDEIQPSPGEPGVTFAARGWSSLNSALTQRTVVILVADDNRIAGIAVTGAPRPDVVDHAILPESELNSGWLGFARVNQTETSLRAYEELSGGRQVCLLSGDLKIPR